MRVWCSCSAPWPVGCLQRPHPSGLRQSSMLQTTPCRACWSGAMLSLRALTKSLERTRAGDVCWQCGRAVPPASLSSGVGPLSTHTICERRPEQTQAKGVEIHRSTNGPGDVPRLGALAVVLYRRVVGSAFCRLPHRCFCAGGAPDHSHSMAPAS